MKSLKLLIVFMGLGSLIAIKGLNSQTKTSPINVLSTGKIVYSLGSNGNNEIYTINANGNNLWPITNSSENEYGPAWSPDATKIAFYIHEENTWSIYKMDSSGSNIQRLTEMENVWDSSPSWSPDGTQISFRREYPLQNYRSEIWVMDADSGSNQQMIDSLCGGQEWSPDGTQFVFSSDRDGDSEIYKMNIDGTNVQQITNNNSEDWWPDWSPDGEKIVFMTNQDGNFEIYVVDTAGISQERLTENSAEDERPDWSPDGEYIAFSSMRDGNYEIYIMNFNGTNQTRLTYTNGHSIQPDWCPTDSGGIGVEELEGITPHNFELFQNYPNPFHQLTTIEFQILNNTLVVLKIYDLLGNEVKTLINKYEKPGKHSVTWDRTDNSRKIAPTGVYYCRIEAGKHSESMKMIIK